MRRALWALFMLGGRNHPAGEIQVGKRQQREQLRAILGEAAIAYLAIAELAFDDPEHVLDFRTHLAEPAIADTLLGRQPVSGRGLLLHRPQHACRFGRALLVPLA